MKIIRLIFAGLVVTWVSACTTTTDAVPVAPTRQVETVEPITNPPTPEVIQPTLAYTPTPIPSPTHVPPTRVPNIFEQLPAVDAIDLVVDPTAGLIAYQLGPVAYRYAQPWLTKADLSEEPIAIPICSEATEGNNCPPEIHWSPTGTHFFYETPYDKPYQLIISDLTGRQQGYTLSRGPYRTPVWSPDGRQLILFVSTNESWGDHGMEASDLDFGFLNEVWQIEMDASGNWLPPQLITKLETPGIGCGGGPRSLSDSLYDRHDGTVDGFHAAQGMIWTTEDVLIYHHACDGIMSQGYGRYDVQTQQKLEPFPGRLHSMAYDSIRNRWYAVTGISRELDEVQLSPNQLVTGVPTEPTYEFIDTAVPVDMVFVGPYSGRIYYTSREKTDSKNLEDQLGWGSSITPIFNFYHTQLWTIEPDGSNERLMWEGDYHSFSRITETPDGNLLFVLIENDEALYEAIVADVPEEEWVDYYPHAHIMRLTPDNKEPEIWLEDAYGLFAWFPQE